MPEERNELTSTLEPVLECRGCSRRPGERHKVRCPKNRGRSQGVASQVAEYDCHHLTIAEGRQIAEDLVKIKVRLGQLGLFRTMHKLDLATTEIGYELADHPEFKR